MHSKSINFKRILYKRYGQHNCEFCSSVFDTEWAKIGHLTSEHSDLNAIVTTIQTRDTDQYIAKAQAK